MDISNNQIKLLSLTTKLNINYDELREQILQNSGEVAENEVYFKLTPASLLEYAEGKEQFALIDLSNKVYAAPENAQNYVSATNLMQFLSKYGIVDYDQLQKSYDALGGIALDLTKLQQAKPSAENGEYWSEQGDTTEEKIYATMIEKVTATLNNISNYVCSCCFAAIEQMLAYTDVTSVTEQEIFDKFEEMMGVSHDKFLEGVKQAEIEAQQRAEELKKAAQEAAIARAKAQSEARKAQEEAAKAAAEAAEKAIAEAVAKAAQEAAAKAEQKAAQEAAAKAAQEAAKAEEAKAAAQAAAEAAAKAEQAAIEKAAAQEAQAKEAQEAAAKAAQEAAKAEQDAIAKTAAQAAAAKTAQKSANIRITQQPFTTLTNFTTSTGEKLSIPIKNVAIEETFKTGEKRIVRVDDSAMQSDKRQINNRIASLRSAMYAAARSERLSANAPLEAGMADLSNLSTAAQRLFSNYKMDENGTYVLDGNGQAQLKTLREKISDAYYITMNHAELDIPQGESKDNAGEIDENEMSVRGVIKSVLKDTQKALGAEGFDTDKYLADHAAYEAEYADLAQAYDAEFANLKALQEPADAEKAQWYTNVWTSMGGADTKLGDDIKMNITRSGAGHGHSRGDYSNELAREIVFPENPVYKKSGGFIALSAAKMNDESLLKGQQVRLEKFVAQETKTQIKPVKINLAPAVKSVKSINSPLKEYEDLKNLTRERNSFESFL